MEMLGSPVYIRGLLDVHTLPEAQVPGSLLADLQEAGLIQKDIVNTSGWTTTLRGATLIKMLCHTPLPEERWIDPREK